MRLWEMWFRWFVGWIQVGYDTIGPVQTILAAVAVSIPIILGLMFAVEMLYQVSVFHHYFPREFGKKVGEVVKETLCSYRVALEVLYDRRDKARKSGGSLDEANKEVDRLRKQMDHAQGWALVCDFGKEVAEVLFAKNSESRATSRRVYDILRELERPSPEDQFFFSVLGSFLGIGLWFVLAVLLRPATTAMLAYIPVVVGTMSLYGCYIRAIGSTPRHSTTMTVAAFLGSSTMSLAAWSVMPLLSR